MKEHLLLTGFPLTASRGFLGWSSAVLLEKGGHKVVLDTGSCGDRHLLLRALAATGTNPAEVGILVLTHLHFDHCLNLDLFPNACIYLSRAEYEYVRSGAFREQGDTAIPPYIAGLLAGRDLVLTEGEHQVGDLFTILPTPGHTPGHVSVLYEREGVPTLFLGDAMKNAWEYQHFPAGYVTPRAVVEDSLRRAKGAAQRFIPGHDRPFRVHGGEIAYEGSVALEVKAYLSGQDHPATAKWSF